MDRYQGDKYFRLNDGTIKIQIVRYIDLRLSDDKTGEIVDGSTIQLYFESKFIDDNQQEFKLMKCNNPAITLINELPDGYLSDEQLEIIIEKVKSHLPAAYSEVNDVKKNIIDIRDYLHSSPIRLKDYIDLSWFDNPEDYTTNAESGELILKEDKYLETDENFNKFLVTIRDGKSVRDLVAIIEK